MNTKKNYTAPLFLAECKTGAGLGSLRRAKGVGSRYRAKGDGGAGCYHVMSRTAGGAALFDDLAKEAFRKMMWRMAGFSGVEVLTYCVMDNHFHILLSVPQRETWLRRFEGGDGEVALMRHLSKVYSRSYMDKLQAELLFLREEGNAAGAELLLSRYKARLCDVSTFVKELKERFSRWYNKVYGRRGTLWMDRFKSVLVESKARGRGRAQGVHDPLQNDDIVLTMANYIDLNPVRAGLCKDPKDYRFSGYAEAVGGSRRARRGLCRAMGAPIDDWEKPVTGVQVVSELYRTWMMGKAVERQNFETGEVIRKGLTRDEARAILEGGGRLTRQELLRCRVRYFTEGVVIGSRAFVREHSPLEKHQLTPGQSVVGLEAEYAVRRAMTTRLVE